MRYCAVALLLVAALAGCDRGSGLRGIRTARADAARATPRHPDGQVRFDSEPGNRGYWGQASVSSLFEKGVQVAMDENGLLANIADAPRVAPFQPWALALYEYRQRNGLKDDPTRACIAPSGPRHLHTAGGFRIIRDPTYDRMYMLFGGGNRNWRVVFMDGRSRRIPRKCPALISVIKRALGRRHAGRRVERLQRALLVLERRAAAHGGVAPHGAFLAARLRHVEI